jgi:hypothetical protein
MTIPSSSHEVPGARPPSRSAKVPIAVAAGTASVLLALSALWHAPATAYDNNEFSPPSAKLAAAGRDTPTRTTAPITVGSPPTPIDVTRTVTTIEPRVDAGHP